MQQLDSRAYQTLFTWSLIHWNSTEFLTVNKNTKKRKRSSPALPFHPHTFPPLCIHICRDTHNHTYRPTHTLSLKRVQICAPLLSWMLWQETCFVVMELLLTKRGSYWEQVMGIIDSVVIFKWSLGAPRMSSASLPVIPAFGTPQRRKQKMDWWSVCTWLNNEPLSPWCWTPVELVRSGT